jgi:hypothetical protein
MVGLDLRVSLVQEFKGLDHPGMLEKPIGEAGFIYLPG